MFVAAKNLCTQERVYLPADKFVILDQEKKVRKPFRPKDENDFLLRNESYGVIKGSLIEKHYLLMIKSSLKELQSQNKRLGDPKRIAIAPAFVEVKDYPLESQKDSKKTRNASTVVNNARKAQREVEKEVAKRFLRASSKSRETEQKLNDLDKTNGNKKNSNGPAVKTSSDKLKKDKETSVENLKKQPPENQSTDETGELNRLDVRCCRAAEELQCLKQKYATLEQENKDLRLAADQSTTLQKIQADLAALKNTSALKGPSVPQPVRGVAVEPEFEGIDVPDNKVYIGQGKFISKHEFLEAEDHASFRMRAKSLCEAFWPGEVHLYSKTGGVTESLQGDNGNMDRGLKKKNPYRRMHPMYHLALKTLLRQMSWGQGVDPRTIVTQDKVSRFLTEHPSEVRRNIKKQSQEWESREKKTRRSKAKSAASNKQRQRLASHEENAIHSDRDGNGQKDSTDRASKRMKKLPRQNDDVRSSESEHDSDAMYIDEDGPSIATIHQQSYPVESEEEKNNIESV